MLIRARWCATAVVLALTPGCVHFFPSDPQSAIGLTMVDGRAAVYMPLCAGARIHRIWIGDAASRAPVWEVQLDGDETIYPIGLVRPGYKQLVSLASSELPRRILLEANTSNETRGIEVDTNRALAGRIWDGEHHLEPHEFDAKYLRC